MKRELLHLQISNTVVNSKPVPLLWGRLFLCQAKAKVLDYIILREGFSHFVLKKISLKGMIIRIRLSLAKSIVALAK